MAVPASFVLVVLAEALEGPNMARFCFSILVSRGRRLYWSFASINLATLNCPNPLTPPRQESVLTSSETHHFLEPCLTHSFVTLDRSANFVVALALATTW